MSAIARRLSSAVLPTATLIAFFAAWEIICRAFDISPIIVPPPSSVATMLWLQLTQGTLLANLFVTLQEALFGFALAAFFGIGLGSIVSEINWARRAILPYLIALQTVPKIAVAPLLVLWFGFGITSKVVIAAMVAVFPVLINTIQGLGDTDPNRVDMLRSVCASRWQVFRMAKFPSALPYIFAGLDAAIVLSLLGAVVGEFIGAQAGLGNFIMIANYRMDIATVFAVLVLLGVVGFTLHALLVAVQHRVVFWTGAGPRPDERS